MKIKDIFNEISAESSTNEKMNILRKYVDNKLLERVLYLANSKRVKFYIKQIPEYETNSNCLDNNLSHRVLHDLSVLSNRIKTGKAASRYLREILENLCPDDAYIIERIIEKDCKIGMGTRNINKVFPNLIEKTGYMGCKSYSRKLIDKALMTGSCYSQEKMDGRFVNIIIQGGEVNNESRQGETTLLDNPLFMSELSTLDDCVINGEITMDGVERYESNGIVASLISIAKKQDEGKDVLKDITKFEKKHMGYRQALDLLRITAWDKLTLDEYFTRTCTRPYNERFDDLNDTLVGFKTLSVVETRIVSSYSEVMEHFREVLSRNGEGTVVKTMNGVWADTKPSYQIKVKKEMNLDLRITGFNYGKVGTKNEHLISSIDVESEDGLLKTSPAGLNEDDMDYVTNHQEELLGKILEINEIIDYMNEIFN
jgi:DNA ligase-1